MDRLDRVEAALDRLTERHEALAQSVEILTRDVHELRTATEELRTTTQEIRAATEKDASNIQTLATIARNTLESIQSLERVAAAQQQRLDDHDERIERLQDEDPR